jgi:hypothetical protein
LATFCETLAAIAVKKYRASGEAGNHWNPDLDFSLLTNDKGKFFPTSNLGY